jgi:hypothetical protein
LYGAKLTLRSMAIGIEAIVWVGWRRPFRRFRGQFVARGLDSARMRIGDDRRHEPWFAALRNTERPRRPIAGRDPPLLA